MFRRSLSPLTAGLFAGLILAWAPLARAGDPADSPGAIEDLATLERTLKDVAEQAIPKTVLVKAIAGPGQMGSGSGAIISPDGYILTCTHVVEIGQTLEVVTADGKSYKAKCLGRNERQDYSLIKIEAKGLPVFELGDSDTVKTGDWVVALGHPGGPYKDLQPAFAAGRVRALDMKLPVGFMKKYYNHAIMTDVPIFAGDSGGPLVDAKGRLVGINGAIVMINEMAFAIPLNQIKPHLADLKQGKNIEGEPPGPEAFQEMQKVISPEDYKKMTSRMFKNFGKLFGGEDNPL
ncbi:MAG: S1C family serine protease, partial [Planctomycetota bacterium]